MMLRKSLTVSGLVLLAAAAAPAGAAESGFYVGATIGQSLFHQDRGEADAVIVDAFNANGFNLTGATSTLDKTDIAFSGLLGYRFTSNLAVEAAYLDLGKLNYKASGTVTNGFTTAPATANIKSDAKGPTLAALGILPLSPAWEVYGRAGIFFSKVTLTAGISVGNNNGSDSVSGNSADPLLGVGAAWHLGNRVTLRAEYTRLVNVGNKDKTGETNIDLFNAAVTYSFN